MTPVGHVAVGFVLGHAPRRAWAPWVAAIGAAVPDVDFVLVWSRHFNEWHRVVTHNLAFVIAVALLGCVPLARRFGASRAAVAGVLALGGLSHLAIDAVMDANASNGIGVALFWPFSDRMVSPFNLATPSSDPRGWDDPLAALAAAAQSLGVELLFVALAIVLFLRARPSIDRAAR
jgi:membrane-bound metal-dependent hydrolase YbcI (DUF457 family)